MSVWLVSLCVLLLFHSGRPPRGCASSTVVVSLCVFPQCHRWKAGQQEGEPGQFHVRQDTGLAVKLGASKRECCLVSGKEFLPVRPRVLRTRERPEGFDSEETEGWQRWLS